MDRGVNMAKINWKEKQPPKEPEPTLEERLATTETQIVTIEETIDVLFGGAI